MLVDVGVELAAVNSGLVAEEDILEGEIAGSI